MHYFYVKDEKCKMVKNKTLMLKKYVVGYHLPVNRQNLPRIHPIKVAANNILCNHQCFNE